MGKNPSLPTVAANGQGPCVHDRGNVAEIDALRELVTRVRRVAAG